MPSVSRAALWTVYLVMLMDTLNFGIVFPLVPSIAKQFGASATLAASMATVYSLCQMIATPILGQLSDRIGRKPILLISLVGTTLSSFGTGMAGSFHVLMAARCINGMSGGTPGVVNAFLADVTTKEERPDYMSYVSVANSVGIIVGPALGGLLSQQGFPTACFVSGTLSAANLVMALLTLKESRWQQARDISASLTAVEEGAAPAAAPAEEAARIPLAANFLFLSGFFLILGFAAMESIVAYYLMDTFFDGDSKKSGQFYGEMFTFVGIVMFIVSGLIYKRARVACGEKLLLTIGACMRTVGFLAQAAAPTAMSFAGALVFCVAGNQLIFPTTSSLLTTMCHKSIYGRALGVQQGFQALSRVLAPVMFGAAYDHLTHKFSFYACAASTILSVALIFAAYAARPDARRAPEPDEMMANVESFEGDAVRGSSFDRGGDIAGTARGLVRSNTVESVKATERQRSRACSEEAHGATVAAATAEQGSR